MILQHISVQPNAEYVYEVGMAYLLVPMYSAYSAAEMTTAALEQRDLIALTHEAANFIRPTTKPLMQRLLIFRPAEEQRSPQRRLVYRLLGFILRPSRPALLLSVQCSLKDIGDIGDSGDSVIVEGEITKLDGVSEPVFAYNYRTLFLPRSTWEYSNRSTP